MSEKRELIRLVVTGASGRMGRLVCDLAMCEPDWRLDGAVAHRGSTSLDQPGAALAGSPTITAGFDGPCDLVIDFSTDRGTAQAIEIARRAGAALLVATTGLSHGVVEAMRAASEQLPILRAPNTSAGVAVAAELVEIAAQCLGPEFRIEIVEAHHRHKRDAPSGTALLLGEAAQRGGSAVKPEQYHSLRGGDIVGEHAVRFMGDGEYLEIRHHAVSRLLFARGALRAGRWLVGRPPGVHTMADVLRR